MSTNYLKIKENLTSVATLEKPTFGSISAVGDYQIDGLWYDKTGILYTEQFTYASQNGKLLEIEVANGAVVDTHYKLPAPKIVEDCIQVGKVIVTDNRATIYIGTVYNNQQVTFENPFGNENYRNYRATAEILVNGEWGESGWYYYSTSGSYGTKAESKERGVAVQTGFLAVVGSNVNAGGTFLTTPALTTSAPCRVNIDYIGEIND